MSSVSPVIHADQRGCSQHSRRAGAQPPVLVGQLCSAGTLLGAWGQSWRAWMLWGNALTALQGFFQSPLGS